MQSATVFNLVRQEHRIKHIDHVLPYLDRESASNRGAVRNSLVIHGEKARSGVVVLTRRRGGAQDGVPYTSAVSIRNLAEPDDIDDKAKRTYFPRLRALSRSMLLFPTTILRIEKDEGHGS